MTPPNRLPRPWTVTRIPQDDGSFLYDVNAADGTFVFNLWETISPHAKAECEFIVHCVNSYAKGKK